MIKRALAQIVCSNILEPNKLLGSESLVPDEVTDMTDTKQDFLTWMIFNFSIIYLNSGLGKRVVILNAV